MIMVIIIIIIIIILNKDLTIEIQHMWNIKTRVIPVITGVTETISKFFFFPMPPHVLLWTSSSSLLGMAGV